MFYEVRKELNHAQKMTKWNELEIGIKKTLKRQRLRGIT